MTATFVEQAGKPKVNFRQFFDSAGECEVVERYAVAASEQNFDRLEMELENTA